MDDAGGAGGDDGWGGEGFALAREIAVVEVGDGGGLVAAGGGGGGEERVVVELRAEAGGGEELEEGSTFHGLPGGVRAACVS